MITDSGNDSDGRFVYALLSVNYAKLLLACIYAPNVFNDDFLPSISSTLLRYQSPYCVVAGDFNATVSPDLDRSLGTQDTVPPSSLALRSFLADLNLVDPWRIRNVNVKAYSSYSCRHGTSSRIDYIFSSPSLINHTPHISMLPILISDHAPVLCTITPFIDHPKIHRWRLMTPYLAMQTF